MTAIDSTTINTIVMAAIVIFGYWLTSHRVKKIRELSDSDNLTESLESKVSKIDCMRFKQRIGNQVDKQKDQMEQIRRSLIFIVSKMGGEPAELGLFDK